MEHHPLVPVIRFWLLMAGLLLLSLVWPECAMYGLFALAVSNACCCSSCTIYSDDYATDKTGTDYTVGSGSFSVSGGVLSTSSASALITANTAAGSSATALYATADINCATTSDKGRLFLAYVDSTHYWVIEIQPGASNGTLKLFQRSGGAETQRGSTQTITGYTSGSKSAGLCSSHGYVTAIAGDASISFASSVTVASTKAGLGTGSGSSSVTFDNFAFKVHYIDNHTCAPCFGGLSCTNCIDSISSDNVQVDIAGLIDEAAPPTPCSNNNGSYILPRTTACVFQLNSCLPDTVDGSGLRFTWAPGGGFYTTLEITAPDNVAFRWTPSSYPVNCEEAQPPVSGIYSNFCEWNLPAVTATVTPL